MSLLLSHWYPGSVVVIDCILIFAPLLTLTDDCCTVPAEGATYTSPAKIPYEFQMSANIKGYHKIVSVTSQKDVLKVETNNDDSTDVSVEVVD